MSIALKLGLAVCVATTRAACARIGDTSSDTAAVDTARGAIETTPAPSTAA